MSHPGPGTSARKVRLRGHEVVSHTTPHGDGRYCCYVFLHDPRAEAARDIRVIKEYGGSPREAERTALATARRFLDLAPAGTRKREEAAGRTVGVAGRRVEIFCGPIGERRWRAFPFLRRADGSRGLITRFHLKEAVTAPTRAAALALCADRLREHFSAAGRTEL